MSRPQASLLLLAAASTIATVVQADHTHTNEAADSSPEEMIVTATRDSHVIDVAETIAITPDAAALLKKAPGANVNGNGPLTGIAQYRGMYGPRINVSVNGNNISSGGPNWMDPPLSYAPAAQLDSLEVYRGIAPVSAGQETIGGAINAKTWQGDFGDSEQFSSSGRLRAGGQSVNDGWLTSAALVAANKNHRIKVSGLIEQGDDAEFDDGSIQPTEYDRQRVDIGYGFRHAGHSIQLDIGRNETGDTGTPALPMDIVYIDSDLGSLQYAYQANDWSLTAKAYYSDIGHGMTNYHLRTAPMSTASYRRNIATGENLGFNVVADIKDQQGHWRFGIDQHAEVHNSNIDNPYNPMFFVTAYNDAKRDVLGVFAEREIQWNNKWLAEFGLRYNRVEMDADQVNGTPAMMTMMGMSPGAMLRDSFNQADRSQADDNIDWVAKLYYQASGELSYYLGLARKTRSASYQERYLWLPLEATAGLADGRSYTGNVALDAEVAHEIELGLDLQSSGFTVSPRIFYRQVDDYIQGTVSSNNAAVAFVNMMNMINGSNNPPPLEFNNVEATLYGFDMDWRYDINEQWSLSGIVNIVRGERDDIDDNLYRIAPANTTLGLNYQGNQWGATIENVLYAEQNKVSKTNSEQTTAGYGLLNAGGYWQLSTEMRLGFGVDNLLDKRYQDHLSGYNRVSSNPDINKGDRLYGYGRNVYARVDYQW